MSTLPPDWLFRLLTHRRTAIAAAATLLVAGIALFFASGIIWIKVFSGFMVGTGATRLVLALHQRADTTRSTPR